ncbi:hypothetical protein [Rhizobium sp. SAFR-030]|uniref:hypothetical protein n=1 Tax=Rhizobium sp. SAFR-030 TaxID=3387277 RepID=UPI003F7DD775
MRFCSVSISPEAIRASRSFWAAAARCEREHRGDVGAQYDHQLRTIRYEIEPVDQRAKLVRRLCPRLLVAELVVESSDFLVIIFCRIGMEQGRRFFRAIEETDQLFFAGCEGHHLRVHPVGSATFQNKVEKRVKFANVFLVAEGDRGIPSG